MVIDFFDGLSYAAGYQFKFELLFFFASEQRIIILIKWKCPLIWFQPVMGRMFELKSWRLCERLRYKSLTADVRSKMKYCRSFKRR